MIKQKWVLLLANYKSRIKLMTSVCYKTFPCPNPICDLANNRELFIVVYSLYTPARHEGRTQAQVDPYPVPVVKAYRHQH